MKSLIPEIKNILKNEDLLSEGVPQFQGFYLKNGTSYEATGFISKLV